MSKREHDADDNEGLSSKMRKGDDTDDGGGSGRSGRVRKKSAKVLEMEEFEQAEKVSHVNKKSKTPKPGNQMSGPVEEVETTTRLILPSKLKAQIQGDNTPVSSKSTKEAKVKEQKRSIPPELTPRISQTSGSTIEAPSRDITSPPIKEEVDSELPDDTELLATTMSSNIKKEDEKSVIKYLLSSPTAGSTPSVNTKIVSPSDSLNPSSSGKKVKKIKTEGATTSKPKMKEKKVKKESVPAELIPITQETLETPSLKMKIVSGSNPMTAQVSLQPDTGGQKPSSAGKAKKTSKKAKEQQDSSNSLEIGTGLLGLPVKLKSPPVKKTVVKKVSKQKEKLIQDAITAAQQMPNLAALVASQPQQITDSDIATPQQKPPKKKVKSASPASASEVPTDDTDDSKGEDEAGESTLVIAETEKKKKRLGGRKKAMKEAESSGSPKEEKKLPKRAPTAYMLFCNTHRPDIVADNPGIDFAAISRKLGELWQCLSNKQKLQWRRKAQRRKKKSNLISTGKISKESSGPPAAVTAPSATSQLHTQMTTNQKLVNFIQRNQATTATAHDETPQSPTKNLSIEPIDVAAHLKLLGESLSIIGMRLQEHKGMIAVQGSLSVLLDSLICACGPLLCLTQQVPGMDGCAPSVHAQTLDSVAYVMPGL